MSDLSDEDKQEKVTAALTNNVITWVKLDDQIRENRAQTKILLDEKKKFECRFPHTLYRVKQHMQTCDTKITLATNTTSFDIDTVTGRYQLSLFPFTSICCYC